ncbi:branched-chain amino acid ABC transporter permease [Siccirubricoccus deserti]|jgi:branched-chain amino acid transport system permease protein|uniref:Branched-chain amino acid ABC transporter permease n=1 Tax=Siccirubricoccus deserti TaxID=2013562 RepID=A0A9X0QVU3_9PROT|nr:branched-chain amino acid ABC transporter permease [Siccirubricoccus deserti]MBC4014825.1 branched-chain amino acid ABC transporter permease [Siccirubricoccus deserti]GGC35335.1 branched-chain amino acid ABC transporter permease [Siccirubricoccus deserti]
MTAWFTDNGLLLGLALLDGLAYAALVFMVAVGLNLVFGVLRIVNVAHGSLFAIGAYTAASIGLFLAAHGLPPVASYGALLLAAVLVGAVLGPPIERLVLRRVYGHEDALQLLVTFALFMILEDVQKLVWGVQPVANDAPMKYLGTVDVPFGEDVIPFTAYQLFVLPGLAVLTLAGLAWFLRRTLTGRVIVAVTTDKEAAMAMGIDATRVTLLTFTFGAALAAFGGALASPTTSLVPGVGAQTIVLSFAVVATAGLGQIEGAAVSALLIGLGRSVAVYFAPEFEVVVPYIIMVAVLLVRPQGLFGVPETRRV